ncbi:MATE family efflux transporter [Parafilimonas terrae]|uniref:Membrane protein involved in the export of O-antigen and teichoic acid n=1 Tax=Parafilimonas terrae TaxID=1465490 RepID=A0A1I5TTZ5_9BACT|nr:polysaccharide biosynthesis C-terminal domain-containing protein [Parafilimonas terrae]SFP86513.1 Membrane protein involved in the export of O-antigen and teichoic acid [Parafilimonas terrae]
MGLKKLLTQGIIWRSLYFFSVLLVNVFLSRYLRAGATGNLYFISIIFSFMQVVLSLGGEPGLTYFASANIIHRNKLLTIAAVWSMAAGAIMALLIYLYYLINPAATSTEITWYCLYGFVFVSGLSLANYGSAIYYTKENYYLPNILLSLVNILYVLLIPGKASMPDEGQVQWITFLYFATYFAGGLLVFASYIILYRKEGKPGFPAGSLFRQLLKYSFTALGANAIFFLVYRVDYVFVKYSPVCTPEDLGNYIQVSKIGQMMLIIPQIIAVVVFPTTASGADDNKLNNAIMAMSRIFSQLFLLIFIGIAIFGKQFFTIVFGESFNKMQLPMLILIPGIFALSVATLLSAYFNGKGKVSVNLYAAIAGLVITIIGGLIFVPKYGIIAAAIVSTISYFVNTAIVVWFYYRNNPLHFAGFFKWKKSDYDWLLSLLKAVKG